MNDKKCHTRVYFTRYYLLLSEKDNVKLVKSKVLSEVLIKF